jgi:hypothetical protein
LDESGRSLLTVLAALLFVFVLPMIEPLLPTTTQPTRLLRIPSRWSDEPGERKRPHVINENMQWAVAAEAKPLDNDPRGQDNQGVRLKEEKEHLPVQQDQNMDGGAAGGGTWVLG